MKKTFLLIAGTAIMFAACNNEPKKEEGPSQAQIDSTVNAKVAEQEAAMKAKNDSVLAAQADSMAKAEEAAKKNTKTTKKTTKTTTTVAPAPKIETPKPTGDVRTIHDRSTDGPKTINDRSTDGPKNIHDRPGGTKNK